MKDRWRTLIAALPLIALYILRHDFWAWWDDRLVLGLPVGLTYHVGLTLAAVAALAILVRFGWPHEMIEEVESLPEDRPAPPAASAEESR